jgi:hypothetical protein
MSLSTQAKLRMNFQVSLLMKNNPLYKNDSNPKTLFESFIGNFSPKRLKTESFIESFISVFLLVQHRSFGGPEIDPVPLHGEIACQRRRQPACEQGSRGRPCTY